MNNFAIVVPAYKEEEIIEEFVRAVQKGIPGSDWQLVVVDDGSPDETPKLLERLKKEFANLTVLTHEVNKGLGMALKTGIEYARNLFDYVVTMDSDLTHPPSLVPEMIDKLEKEKADVCIASRYVKGGGMQDVPFWRVMISVLANFFFQIFLRIKARDVTAGFKAYRSSAIKMLDIERSGFAVQLEIMVKLAKNGCKFVEVPLMLKNRKKGNSKFRFFRMVPKYVVEIMKLFWLRWFG